MAVAVQTAFSNVSCRRKTRALKVDRQVKKPPDQRVLWSEVPYEFILEGTGGIQFAIGPVGEEPQQDIEAAIVSPEVEVPTERAVKVHEGDSGKEHEGCQYQESDEEDYEGEYHWGDILRADPYI